VLAYAQAEGFKAFLLAHLKVGSHLLLHKILFSSHIRIQSSLILRKWRHGGNTARTAPSWTTICQLKIGNENKTGGLEKSTIANNIWIYMKFKRKIHNKSLKVRRTCAWLQEEDDTLDTHLLFALFPSQSSRK
jgi:hypothetical protein